jgi:hypothetical protein
MTFMLGRLLRGPRYGERVVYSLVGRKPQARTRAPFGQQKWAREGPPPPLLASGVCRSCGVLLEGANGRLYCDTCLPARLKEVGASAFKAGRAVLGRLRAGGDDPAHGGVAARKRGRKVRRAIRERARWQDVADADTAPEVFQREILPGLRGVPLGIIARATGVSEGYASFIRRGLRIPHPRYWDALKSLIIPKENRHGV